jgi:hypothetical protein
MGRESKDRVVDACTTTGSLVFRSWQACRRPRQSGVISAHAEAHREGKVGDYDLDVGFEAGRSPVLKPEA